MRRQNAARMKLTTVIVDGRCSLHSRNPQALQPMRTPTRTAMNTVPAAQSDTQLRQLRYN